MADSDTENLNLTDVIIHGVPVSLDKLSPVQKDLVREDQASTRLHSDSVTSSLKESDDEALAAVNEAHRFYFEAGEDRGNKCEYVCSEDYKPPVNVDPSIGIFRWQFQPDNLREKFIDRLYDIVVAFSANSAKALNIDLIETITFRIAPENEESETSSELISRQDLNDMRGADGGLVQWRQSHQLRLRKTKEWSDPTDYPHSVIEMEFRLSDETSSAINLGQISSAFDPGHFELHFMELRASENAKFERESSNVPRRPLMWSLDVHHGSETDGPATILHFAFFSDRSHIATLADFGNSLTLELWNIENHGSRRFDERPRLCAMRQFTIEPTCSRSDLFVSLSLDGSQVVMLDTARWDSANNLQSFFSVYRHDHDRCRQAIQPSELALSGDYKHCKEFDKFPNVYSGLFHITSSSDRDPRDEIFIAGVNLTVCIFNVFQKWEHVRSISGSLPMHGPHRLWSYGCSGKYFARSMGGVTAVWDIEQWIPISIKVKNLLYVWGSIAHAISDDGSMLATVRLGFLAINEIASGIDLQSIELPTGYRDYAGVRFIENDTQLLVQTTSDDTQHGRRLNGLILDAQSLLVVNRIMVPGDRIDVVKSPGAEDHYYAAHGSRLRRIHLHDCIIQPNSRSCILPCDETCKDNLIDCSSLPTEFTARSGLHFEVTWSEYKEMIVLVTPPSGYSFKFRNLSSSGYNPYKPFAVFLDKQYRLAVFNGRSFSVLGLPETIDGEFTLLFFSGNNDWKTLDMNRTNNPISFLLKVAELDPRGIQLVEDMIKFCIQQAKWEKDAQFLLPVVLSMHELVNLSKPYVDLAMSVLRQLAYLPVKSRKFLLNNHTIVHPLQLRFWKRNELSLHRLKDPILQMACGPVESDFSSVYPQDLFAATFDLLWRVHVDPSVKTTPRLQNAALNAHPVTCVALLLHGIQHLFSVRCAKTVKIHPFTPEMLDNPAIIAPIEYKWNTIGFKYWMTRFLCQCCFYALVLTAVFMNIYDNHRFAPAGIFIAILISSSLFLWLEILQMIRDFKRYLDLAAFGLPLAGSINQLLIVSGRIQGATLFELRINSTVCQFVTIITGIIGKIRIFVFLFAGGIFAFSISILHILRACLFEECEDPTTKLPSNFFYALSATYFFMGGRYEAVDDNLDSESYWQFHVMMMAYFFFMVILLLNVLIALINEAYSDGTWRQMWTMNRLQVIERAETLSFQIPGFRQSSLWFPREIYYSATKRRVQEFREKYPTYDHQGDTSSSEQDDPRTKLMKQQEAFQQEIKKMQDKSNKRHEDQLLALKEQHSELKKQLREQQDLLAAQMSEMMAFMKEQRAAL
ncbi:unnamed protein product [Mortierella alpina]